MNDGQIKVAVILDSTEATKSLDTLETKSNKLSTNFGKIGKGLTVGATVPIVALGTAALKGASELEATEAKYNTVFDGMTEQSDGFIEEFRKLTPATTAEARNMASGIQDLLVPMGFMRDEATNMTGDTMNLVGALANFNSGTHTSEQVASAFQSALTGETQSLKGLGIQVDQTQIQERALQKTGKKTTKELTKQDKATALLEMAYEQSGDALAAYNEESLDTKTRTGLATSEFQDQIAVLGEQLLPIFNNAISLLTTLTSWFANLSPEAQKMILIGLGLVAALGPFLTIISGLITAMPILIGFIGLLTSPIGLVILAIGAIIAIIVLLWNKCEWFRNLVMGMFENFKLAFNLVKTVVVAVFKFLWGIIKKYVTTYINIFKGIWTAISWVIEKIKYGFSRMAEKVKSIFYGIKSVVSGIFSGLISLLKAPINLVISGLNKINFSIPDWVPLIGGKHFGINIPKLKVGTDLVNQDGLAYLHKGESVVPANVVRGGYSNQNQGNQIMELTIQAPVKEGVLFETTQRINLNKNIQTGFGG